jgi:hypothetical protein
MVPYESVEGTGTKQRHVSRQQDESARRSPKEWLGLEQRVPRSALWFLEHGDDPGADERLLDLRCLVPNDHDYGGRRQGGRRTQHVREERPIARPM